MRPNNITGGIFSSLVLADPTLQYRVGYRPPSWVLRFRSYCLAMIKKKLNKNIFN